MNQQLNQCLTNERPTQLEPIEYAPCSPSGFTWSVLTGHFLRNPHPYLTTFSYHKMDGSYFLNYFTAQGAILHTRPPTTPPTTPLSHRCGSHIFYGTPQDGVHTCERGVVGGVVPKAQVIKLLISM